MHTARTAHRACARAPQLPYRVVEVNPLTKTELKWSTYKKARGLLGLVAMQLPALAALPAGGVLMVCWWCMHTHNTMTITPCLGARAHTRAQVPVLQADGDVVVDSTVILSRLAAEVEAAQAKSKCVCFLEGVRGRGCVGAGVWVGEGVGGACQGAAHSSRLVIRPSGSALQARQAPKQQGAGG